jgi:hypothetical protein
LLGLALSYSCLTLSHLRKSVIKIPHRVSIDINLSFSVPIAHELEPILCPVRDLIVLVPHVFQHFKKVQSAAGVDRRYWSVSFAILDTVRQHSNKRDSQNANYLKPRSTRG